MANHEVDDADDLIRKLDSTALTIATSGYIDGRSFPSRREMRFALAIAVLYAGGSRREIRAMLLHRVPNAFRIDDRRDPDTVVDRDFDEAEHCYFADVDSAICVRFYCAYVSRTRLASSDAGQVCATLCFARIAGTGNQIRHTVNIRLVRAGSALARRGPHWRQFSAHSADASSMPSLSMPRLSSIWT